MYKTELNAVRTRLDARPDRVGDDLILNPAHQPVRLLRQAECQDLEEH